MGGNFTAISIQCITKGPKTIISVFGWLQLAIECAYLGLTLIFLREQS